MREPQANDPKLQALANDPSLRIKELNNSKDQAEYEFNAQNKTLKIKIDLKVIQ